MSEKKYSIFKAISDPTRRKIIHLLLIGGQALTINQLVDNFDGSRQSITKHIKTLESAGLLEIQANGRERVCVPNPKPLKEVQDWVNMYEKFWDSRLDALEHFLKGGKA